MAKSTTPRICKEGHRYFKRSDCPTCPICEANKSSTSFLIGLSAPARRALENSGITTITKLASYSKKQILALHGIGPASIPILTSKLKENGLDFKRG